MLAILMLLPLSVLTLLSEYLWRKKLLRGEGGRKFVHILSGVWISAWPYFVGYRTIQLLSIALLLIALASRFLHVFRVVRDVKRRTLGDLLFPLAVLTCASLTPATWVFTTAMLYLALADGLAAVVGTRYKKVAHYYQVFGQKKSVLGTLTYFVTALVILFVSTSLLSPESSFVLGGSLTSLLSVVVVATLLENLSPYGSDNLSIPLFIVIALR